MAEARSDREQQTQTTKEGQSQSQSQKLISPAQRGEVRRRSGSDYATNPFELMRRITEQMLGPLVPSSVRGLGRIAEETWAPQIEVFERDGKLVVRADLPGMSKDDVKVEVRDNTLIIQGERNEERKEDREGYFITERSYGSFYRAIPLPEGANPDKARATFQNGVLEMTVDLPTNQSQGKSIPIEESRESREPKEGREQQQSKSAR
jgi:HSP20 family protein